MSVNTGAVAVGRKFGDALKEARLKARRPDGRPVRQVDVADALERSTRDRYSRLERGLSFPDPDEWETICSVLNLNEATRKRLEGLIEAGRALTDCWWREFEDDFPESLLTFVALEDAAQRITSCAVNVLPALLQTADYARAITIGTAGSVLTPDAVERSVELRRRRRSIFDKPTPTPVEFIFSEAALKQRVGGTAVMLKQLESLLDDGASRSITLRVVSYAAAAPPTYPMHLLHFGGDGEKPITAFDSMTGMTLQKRPREVRETRYSIEGLSRVALPHLESIELIKDIKKELASA